MTVSITERTMKQPDEASPLATFWRSEDGATSIEYSLIVALIFLAIVAAVRTFSESTSGMYSGISDDLSSAN